MFNITSDRKITLSFFKDGPRFKAHCARSGVSDDGKGKTKKYIYIQQWKPFSSDHLLRNQALAVEVELAGPKANTKRKKG